MKKNVLKEYLLTLALFLGTTVGFSQTWPGDFSVSGNVFVNQNSTCDPLGNTPVGDIKVTATPKPVNIGDTYQGGIVFHLDGNGGGLVATPNDIFDNGRSKMLWSRAMSLCNNLIIGGYDDWHLPSKDDLNLLRSQQNLVGGFAYYSYWSSTEFDGSSAWRQSFGSGNQYFNGKNYGSNVRAVRAFSLLATDAPISTFTNSDGEYSLYLKDEGDYTITVDLSSTPQWGQDPSCDENYSQIFNTGKHTGLDFGLDLSGIAVTTTDETCAGNDGSVTLDIPGYEAGSVDVSSSEAGSIVVPGTQVYWSSVNMTSGVLHVKGTAVFYGDLTIGADVVGLIEGTVSVYGNLTIAGKVHNLGNFQATGQTTITGSLNNEGNVNLTNLVSGSVTSGSPAANYSVVWEDGFEGVTRNDLSEGTYIVTVINLAGESGEIEVVVGKECVVPPGPTVVVPFPNPVSGVGDLTIKVTLPADEPNFELRLNSYWGTLLNEVHNGPLSAGDHTFRINIPNQGFYLKYLQYSSNGGSGAIMITRMPY